MNILVGIDSFSCLSHIHLVCVPFKPFPSSSTQPPLPLSTVGRLWHLCLGHCRASWPSSTNVSIIFGRMGIDMCKPNPTKNGGSSKVLRCNDRYGWRGNKLTGRVASCFAALSSLLISSGSCSRCSSRANLFAMDLSSSVWLLAHDTSNFKRPTNLTGVEGLMAVLLSLVESLVVLVELLIDVWAHFGWFIWFWRELREDWCK